MSLIMKRYKALFVHVPKTAGGSIKETMAKLGGGHTPIWKYSKSTRNEYFKFAFVRDPHTRFVSASTAIFYLANNKILPTRSKRTTEELKHKITQDAETLYRIYKGPIKPKRIFKRLGKGYEGWPVSFLMMPMFYFLTDSNNNVLMDFIGRYEHLDRDYRGLCKILGCENTNLLHLRNANKFRPPMQEIYSKEALHLVAELYKTDFELFGYDRRIT